MSFDLHARIATTLLCFVAGCGAAAAVPTVSPAASKVVVRKASPPPGATEVGAIEVEHGSGCGMYGRAGTLEGAMALMKEEAHRRNADYVELLMATEPHSESGCFDQTFKLKGMAYKLGSGTLPDRAKKKDAAKAKDDHSPPSDRSSCSPPCSPGYSCSEGKCLPVCNPPCVDGQVCRDDRTCGPAESASPTAGP